MGAIPLAQIYTAASNFWIGDTVGMIVVLPAATAIYDIVSRARWRVWLRSKHLVFAVVIGACIATFVLMSASNVKNRYLFDLLFLPVLWVGINYGYSAVAMTLLATQLMLIGAPHAFRRRRSRFLYISDVDVHSGYDRAVARRDRHGTGASDAIVAETTAGTGESLGASDYGRDGRDVRS